MNPKDDMRYAKLSIIVIALAIVFRVVLALFSAVSGDACWHFSAAKFIANEKEFPLFEQIGRDEPFWAPPMFHVIASIFYLLFGEVGLKIVPPLFGSLALIVSYLIFRKSLSYRAAFYAILFLSFIPFFIDYSILGYVESLLAFFAVLSIYFALSNRLILSGITAGFAILTKYNGLFIIPVIIFIACKNTSKKEWMKNFLAAASLPILIGLPWLIRNWILLGNPIWPFLNFIFGGFQRLSFSSVDISRLISGKTYIATYLGFFGIPDGNYNLLSFFDIPYFWALMPVFLAGTFIFILPLLFGFKKSSAHQIFYALLASFTILFILYVINVGILVTRVLLPAIIAIAFIYGSGCDTILKKIPRLEKMLTLLLVIIVIGFSSAEAVKFMLAANSWNFYNEDFEWAKSNTGKGSVFLIGSQCIPFHLDRKAVFPSLSIDTNEYDYVWVNQQFKLEPQSILSKEQLYKIKSKKLEMVYKNKKTKTEIYKLIKDKR